MSQILTVIPNVTYTLTYGLAAIGSARDNDTFTNYWGTTLAGQLLDELIGIQATPQDQILNRQATFRVPPRTTQVLLQFVFRTVCPVLVILLKQLFT
jgi:hypothetical protein